MSAPALPEIGRATCAEWAQLAAASADHAAHAAAWPVLLALALLAGLVVVAAIVLDARAARRHAELRAALEDLPGRGDYYRDLAATMLRRDGIQ
jgi:hypothetical protein